MYQYSEDILRVEDIQQFEAILGFEDILSGRGHSALVSSAPSTGATTVPCHSTFRGHFEVFRQGFQETGAGVVRVWCENSDDSDYEN